MLLCPLWVVSDGRTADNAHVAVRHKSQSYKAGSSGTTSTTGKNKQLAYFDARDGPVGGCSPLAAAAAETFAIIRAERNPVEQVVRQVHQGGLRRSTNV